MASYDLHLIEEDTPDKDNPNKDTSFKDYLLCIKNPFTALFLVIAGFILAMILSVWVGLAALPVVVLLLTLIVCIYFNYCHYLFTFDFCLFKVYQSVVDSLKQCKFEGIHTALSLNISI